MGSSLRMEKPTSAPTRRGAIVAPSGGLALLALLAGFALAPGAGAAPIPASPADSIRVTLDRGEIHDVRYVEYLSTGNLRLVASNGRTTYVGVHRVVSIEGESGEDYTGLVIEQRRHVGEPPPAWSAAPDDSIRVSFDLGADLHVAYVEYVSLGSLRVVGANGQSRYVDASRVAAVEGPDGQDLTAAVIERRGHAGTPPAGWLQAQKEPGFRLVARPLPDCTSFALTEIGVLVPLRTADKTDADHAPSVVLDYGWMKNVGPRHAVGFVAHGEVGANRLRLGPGLRYRRWYTRSTALDVTVGALVAGSEDATSYEFDGPGLFGQVDYQVEGLLALTGQVETTALRYSPPLFAPAATSRRGGVDVRMGAKLGAGLGIAATIGLAIPIAAVIAVLAGGAD